MEPNAHRGVRFPNKRKITELFSVVVVTGMKKPNIEDRQRPSARQAVIEDNLKRVYEATLAEDMPDRFKLLLDQLRDKERGQ